MDFALDSRCCNHLFVSGACLDSDTLLSTLLGVRLVSYPSIALLVIGTAVDDGLHLSCTSLTGILLVVEPSGNCFWSCHFRKSTDGDKSGLSNASEYRQR